ncbi:target of rapamycin complex 2 subunit MAPKAP1-like isoform X2 [Gigantopelta aegis]|uniref:target of rapamycin complex 2 subunit MAPKAP1-like isoform X2 n=1 Tax=Gigantopelta aegis TaxID=1735272 RepID=UPI001B888B3F|nr:target of rapamycin complex 2 subunit MAPKAP1-like isoform X2 [Gigantopelta aegis]
MAMMDNAGFLVSHIRNSFITSDDTGMCELIIESDEPEKRTKRSHPYNSYWMESGKEESDYHNDSGLDISDGELSHSYDIIADMDYGAHRRRSNTAQRLERMKKEKRTQCKVKTITWKNAPMELTAEDKKGMFEKKSELVAEGNQDKDKRTSLLSQMLTTGSRGENPFSEYAKFDGRTTVGIGTKKIDIYLTMAPPSERSYPIPVIVTATAKVQDLIGLICWQYTNEGRESKMSENLDLYCLHIAEDDGEVDMDFPSLDNREPVSKFGFAKLALVQRAPSQPVPKVSLVVTVTVPNKGFNKFQVPSANIQMKVILEKVIRRRKIKVRPGLNYNLEKQEQPGTAIDLDSTLDSMDTMEFCLVRENSTRGDSQERERHDSSDVAESLTSHQYKSYIVSMVHRLIPNSDVQLGISGEKVEIDPVVSKGSVRLFRQRPVTYDADSIADCDILEQKSNGRNVFRMTYQTGHECRHHDFEADHTISLEIVQKINNILELRLSRIRKDFVANKEKKMLKKRDSIKFS